jgi:hypothetical protein
MKALLALALCAGSDAASPWSPATRARAAAKVASMSQADKLKIVYGSNGGYVGTFCIELSIVTVRDGGYRCL